MNDSVADAEDLALLNTFLSERDCPCPFCDYNLRDLQTDRCPECGEQLRLNVQAVDPKIGWPLAGLIGLSAGAGFSLLMTVYFLVYFAKRGLPSGGMIFDFWTIVILPLVIQAAMLVAWLKSWRALRRATKARRVTWAMLAWLVPAVNIVLFSIYIK